MLTRRDLLQAAASLGAFGAGAAWGREAVRQEDLLQFEPLGQVTLLHFTDIHAQLSPIHFREPAVNIGVGEQRGVPPHLTGKHLLAEYGLPPETAAAYALGSERFLDLARDYGRMGGVDRMATLIRAIRAERPGRTLLLDGGDTWQGSYTALRERGADMVRVQQALGVEAMTGHWEFTYGAGRVAELREKLGFPFLCGNVKDATWGEDVFDHTAVFERGGLRIAVIGQAFPYTPIANPRWMIPDWSFGIGEDRLRERIAAARGDRADLVVLLSHNGLDVDRKLATRVAGLDVILSGHTHDAVPVAIRSGGTLIVASGSHGKFLSRLDLEVRDRRIADFRFRLIPIFSDAIAPERAMSRLVEEIRAPHAEALDRVVGRTDSLLYRRGNFNGTFDDVICASLIEQRDAEITLSPGFRWGATLLPGEDIRLEDIYNQTAITYPAAYRSEMTGAALKDVLEDVADNLFNPDPYYQQGGDMVRVGGLAYVIDVEQPAGRRISELTLLRTGQPIDPAGTYTVAGWGSVNEGAEGPPIWDVLTRHIEARKVVSVSEPQHVKVRGADPRGMAL
jgi:sulfur-oxidizing protein SoxB